jgi:hypothetical protein
VRRHSRGARSSSVIVALVLSLPTGHAIADGPISASLDYEAEALLPCPSAIDFQKAVVRHLHYDPFRANPAHHILVRIRATSDRIEGRVEWRDAADQWEGERTFSSRNESCAHVARAMALATAIQIQLLAVAGTGAEAPTATDTEPFVEPAPPPPAATVERAPPLTPSPDDLRLAIEAGAGLLQDLGESPTFALPRLVVLIGRPSATGLRIAASGLGPSAQVTQSGGSARLDRLVLTLELIRFFRSDRRLQPLLAAGVGAQDVRAQGTSAMPSLAAAHAGQAFSAVLAAGAGAAVALTPTFALVVEVDALLFRPSVTVQIGSTAAAHLDGAALFAHGGVLARF